MAVTDMIPPAQTPKFLMRAGWDDASVLPLAGDASFRRYFRVVDERRDRVAVLMDAPPPHEDPRPFLAMSAYLRDHGFRAPATFYAEPDNGLALIEDFGNNVMRAVVDQSPEAEHGIYRQCVDLLVALAACPAADVPDYDWPTYAREAALLTEWTAPALGLAVDGDSYLAAWKQVLTPIVGDTRRVTVLRDFHAENVMITPPNQEHAGRFATLGLLDFQDALVGHPAYDLVSMLQDARRDVSPALEQAMLDHYCAQTGQGDDFRAAYAVIGAQRNAKIIGIFTRLAKRDGKLRYIDLIPRMWALLDRDLAHPDLAPVAAWFADNIPVDARSRLSLEFG